MCTTTISKEDHKPHRVDTYEIVSRVGYLCGVEKKFFNTEYAPMDLNIYEQLDQIKEARIIRNLCRLRTAIIQHYSTISYQIFYELKNLNSFPNLIPQDTLDSLEKDGIQIIKVNHPLNSYSVDINRHLTNHINNVRDHFPIWLNFMYIKNMILIPNGQTEAGVKAAATKYTANRNRYPYQCFINWVFKVAECGNLFACDKKFCSLLYAAHNDLFTDTSNVKDATNDIKESIYDFLEVAEKCIAIIDCENSDVYKVVSMLQALKQQALLGSISKIILCDDANTSTAWDLLGKYTQIPVEHLEITRVSNRKSLVDTTLCVKVCTEHFQNNVDSVILFSSDSDFFGLYNNLPVRYLVMVEHTKIGSDCVNLLQTSKIPFCYIDDFARTSGHNLKIDALLNELRCALGSAVALNINTLLQNALLATRSYLSDVERRQFYDRYIKRMHIDIQSNGDLSLVLGE